MKKEEAKKRAGKLRIVIDDLRYRYHVLDDPTVTDQIYDSLTTELREIERQFPDLVTPDSPTQKIGGVPLKKFKKIAHIVPQWSFSDAFTEKEIHDFDTRVKKMLGKALGRTISELDYVVELKIDGLHVVLTYTNGLFETAATRGDGKIGEDVTHTVKTIQSLPLRLRKDVSVVVEGEVWIAKKDFEKVNKKREQEGKPLFANPRNAAAGAIRQLDPIIARGRELDAILYDISLSDFTIPHTQQKELEILRELGFKTDQHWKQCINITEVITFWKTWTKKKETQPFWIDGVVVKVNKREYQTILGFTGKAPRWALAIKFAPEQATSVVQEVHFQVGRTGAITPVATLKPVALGGTTVTHATLHNFDEIKRLDVRIGDTVVVEKAGDIIPKITKVITKLRTGKEKSVHSPRVCPICKSPLIKKEEVALYCSNTSCYAQQLRKNIHFVSKKAFDIEGLGKKIVEQLMQTGLVSTPADFFTLREDDLKPLERFAEKSAKNLIEAIAKRKHIPLNRFIHALSIRHVGEENAYILANEFKTIENFASASEENLKKVNGIGYVVAQSIFQFFQNVQNKELLTQLAKNGVVVEIASPSTTQGPLTGRTFVLTGTLPSLTRGEAEAHIRKHGGMVSSAVSKKTDYVLVGKNPGSKLNTAKKIGVSILNEEEFKKLLK